MIGGVRDGQEALPEWYRTAAAASWRFLVIVAAAGVVLWALVYLHVVVLPIIIALLASTLLLPVVRWLKSNGAPDALAAAGAMLAAFLLVAAIVTAIAPSIGDQFSELRPRAEDGLREATDVLAEAAVQPQRDGDPGPGRRDDREVAREQRAARPAGCPAAPSSSARSSPGCSSRCC